MTDTVVSATEETVLNGNVVTTITKTKTVRKQFNKFIFSSN